MKTRIFTTFRTGMAIVFGMMALPGWSQPDWSVVPENYEFSMLVTGLAKFECLESDDPNDIVAAFIGDEVRGVQAFNTTFEGHHYSYLIVYDNVFSGNQLHFKLYDASEDTVIAVEGSISFRENLLVGNIESPYYFHTLPGIGAISTNRSEFSDTLTADAIVAELSAHDTHGEEMAVTYQFIDDVAGQDNHFFYLDGSSIKLQSSAATLPQGLLNLHVLASPAEGCQQEYAFHLQSHHEVLVGTDDPDKGTVVTIYPNPSNDWVNWSTKHQIQQVELRDLHGKVVLQKSDPADSRLFVGNLPSGEYVILLQSAIGVHPAVLLIQ